MDTGARDLIGWAGLIALIVLVLNWPWHALTVGLVMAVAVAVAVAVNWARWRRDEARYEAELAQRAANRLAAEAAELRAAGFPETLIDSWTCSEEGPRP